MEICAGVMWPMIATFGMRLVEPNNHGKSVAVIMAGNTLGISLGMPVMTYLGNALGWRNEFIILGVIIAVIGILSLFMLPSTPGEKLTSSTSHFAFFLWGLSFGPLVTLFQAAVSRQVDEAKDVATSLQSSAFNFSIMIATFVGGVALINFSALSLPALSILIAIPGIIISLMAKRTLN